MNQVHTSCLLYNVAFFDVLCGYLTLLFIDTPVTFRKVSGTNPFEPLLPNSDFSAGASFV